MKKKTIYILGLLMVCGGVLSTLYFAFRLQNLFQLYLSHYVHLFNKGFMGRCLYLDIAMFLYIASILFKNLYYVIGGILILCFVEFGRELGIFAALIGFVTEASFRLVHLVASDPSIVTPFSMAPFFLFLIGISIHLTFFYFLTRRPMVAYLKGEHSPKG